jgi:hypothetical protein
MMIKRELVNTLGETTICRIPLGIQSLGSAAGLSWESRKSTALIGFSGVLAEELACVPYGTPAIPQPPPPENLSGLCFSAIVRAGRLRSPGFAFQTKVRKLWFSSYGEEAAGWGCNALTIRFCLLKYLQNL